MNAPFLPKRLALRWSKLSGNIRGALLMLVSAAIYSILVALIKAAATEVPVPLIMFFSVVVQFAFIGGRGHRDFGKLLRQRRGHGAHMVRTVLLTGSMMSGFYAVAVLPLAESTAISFSKSLFVTLLAALALREAVGPRRWLSVGIGFLGILVLTNPVAGTLPLLGLAAAVLSAMLAAGGAIYTRVLAQRSESGVLLLYQTAGGTLLLLPLALWFWQTPDPATLLLLLSMGLLSVVGNSFMIAALRVGEASALAPVDFTRAIFSGLLGYALFREIPGPLSIVGMIVIVFATLLSMGGRRARAVGRPPDHTP